MEILAEDRWRSRAERHSRRVGEELVDVIHRRDRGLRHPVDDFLFRYYNLRPSQLLQWHPGISVGLENGHEFEHRDFYLTRDLITCLDVPRFVKKRGKTVLTAHRLLSASASAEARFGCFGMHEWAMVYGLAPDQTRHPYLRLRFEPDEIARIVEEVGCRCSHFDAFRFFTDGAKPLNLLLPTRERQPELDQPGCLHVNMDLYKWAGKLHPAVSSDLLFETYLLARDIRTVDMAASAYDLREWGYEPIKVETAEGRAEYAALQRAFAVRAEPLRGQLLAVTSALAADDAEISRVPEAL